MQAADRLGRKPVLVFSMFGVTIATALFGMSTTVWQMVIFRCIAGVFAGSLVCVSSALLMVNFALTKVGQFEQ